MTVEIPNADDRDHKTAGVLYVEGQTLASSLYLQHAAGVNPNFSSYLNHLLGVNRISDLDKLIEGESLTNLPLNPANGSNDISKALTDDHHAAITLNEVSFIMPDIENNV